MSHLPSGGWTTYAGAVVLRVPLDAVLQQCPRRRWRSRPRRRSCPWAGRGRPAAGSPAISTTTPVASHEHGSEPRCRAAPAGAGRPSGTARSAPRRRRRLAASLGARVGRSSRSIAGLRALSPPGSPRDRRLRSWATVGTGVCGVDRAMDGQRDGRSGGRLVLLGAPLGNPADASARLREVLGRGGRGRRRGHPPAGPAGPRPRRHRRPAGSSPTSRATRSGVPRSWSRRCAAARVVAVVTDGGMPSVSDPGLPAGPGGAGRRAAGHRRARPERGDDRAGAVRAALRPVLLRGLPAAQAGGERRARLRELAAEPRTLVLLRGAAPDRRRARRPGRGVRRGPAGRGLPRADQDVRGGPPRPARRAGRLGRRAASRAARSPLVVGGAPAGRGRAPADDELRAAVAAARGRRRRRAGTRSRPWRSEYGLPKRDGLRRWSHVA